MGAAVGVWLRGGAFLLAAAAVLIPSYLLFRLRMLGAGDGKLMALIAGYLGLSSGMRAICAGLSLGAVWSLCRIWHDKSLLSRFTYLNAYIWRTILTKELIPYEQSVSEEPSVSQQNRSTIGQLSAGESRHTIPLAACLAAGTYLYLLVSRGMVVGKEFL